MKWEEKHEVILEQFNDARKNGEAALNSFFEQQWDADEKPLLRQKMANALLHQTLRDADAIGFAACKAYCYEAYEGYNPYDPRTGVSMFVELAHGHAFGPGSIERQIADQEFDLGDENLALRQSQKKGKDSVFTDKRRFLHWAIEEDHSQAFEWMVKKGANLDGFSPKSKWKVPSPLETVLTTAVRFGALDKVRTLLEHGADPKTHIVKEHRRQHRLPLEMALEMGDWECLLLLSTHSPGVWPRQWNWRPEAAGVISATQPTRDPMESVDSAKCWIAARAQEWIASRMGWLREAQDHLKRAQQMEEQALDLEDLVQRDETQAQEQIQRDKRDAECLVQEPVWWRWVVKIRNNRRSRREKEEQTDASSLLEKSRVQRLAIETQKQSAQQARAEARRLQAYASVVAADPGALNQLEQCLEQQGERALREPLHGFPLLFMATCLDLASFDASSDQILEDENPEETEPVQQMKQMDSMKGSNSLSSHKHHQLLEQLFGGSTAFTGLLKAQMEEPLDVAQSHSLAHFTMLFNRLDLLHCFRTLGGLSSLARVKSKANVDPLALALRAGSTACVWDELDYRGIHEKEAFSTSDAKELCMACVQSDQADCFEDIVRRWETHQLPWSVQAVEQAIEESQGELEQMAWDLDFDPKSPPSCKEEQNRAQWNHFHHWFALVERARLLIALRAPSGRVDHECASSLRSTDSISSVGSSMKLSPPSGLSDAKQTRRL